MQHFDVETLSRRTGIAQVKLEQCVTEGFADRSWMQPENPYPERLDEISGVSVVLAACLYDFGCSGDAVRWHMRAITNFLISDRNSLHLPLISHAVQCSKRAIVQLADGTHLRWQIGTEDTSWCRFSPQVLADSTHTPRSVIAFDVGRIRDQVRGTVTPT